MKYAIDAVACVLIFFAITYCTMRDNAYKQERWRIEHGVK